MRGFLSSVTLMLILAVFCVVYTNASKNFIGSMYDCAEKLEKNSFSSIKNSQLLDELENTFSKNEKLFAPFMNHDILEEAGDHISRARVLYTLGNEDLFRLEICTLKSYLGDMLDEQKANFSNILKKE